MGAWKKLGRFLLVLIILLLIAGTWFILSLRPQYDGKQELPGLGNKATVYYDPYGIPHIFAENERDAFRALGYVHAQDRLWQMELLRRVASGGLSEVFGSDLIQTDKFFLALGIDAASEKTVATLDKGDSAVVTAQAYLAGINHFIATGPTPVEFYLTGLEKRAFTLKDIHNIMGYMAFSFAMAHKTDPLLTDIKARLGSEYLADLRMDVDTNTVWIANHPQNVPDTIGTSLTARVWDALSRMDLPLFEGSNGWAIAPTKTKGGAVLFANDPHIGFSQPAVWYEAHVSTPTYEKYGHHLAGVPFPILGHNHQLAYGMTMFENDDVDFYFEEVDKADSTRYRAGGQWQTFKTIAHTIRVKDAPDEEFIVRRSGHGPIMNDLADQIKSGRPISMSWIYTQRPNKLLRALFNMAHARDIQSFRSALPDIHAPGLNIMYGDAEGNVAWWATAKLYQIPERVQTKLVFEPGEGLPMVRTYLDFSRNPQAVNPPWHYVYSANNQPDSIAGMQYPGYYLPENRAKRIVALLESTDTWDREGVGRMITDVVSPVDSTIAFNLTQSVDREGLGERYLRELDRLMGWKGDYPLESVSATVFTRWISRLLGNIYADELGEERFKQLLSTHLLKRVIAPMATDTTSVWWDDIGTDIRETSKDIIQKSFEEAIASLVTDFGPDHKGWAWGNVHTLEHGHPIGQVAALRGFFNVGPFPIAGSREVINNMAFGYDDKEGYQTTSGPSTRRVIDFSDIGKSLGISPTGQSGNPLSPHYDDQAELYNNNGFRPMMLDSTLIVEEARNILELSPNDTD